MDPIGIIIGIVIGGAATVLLLNTLLKKKRKQILEEAEKQGETLKKDKILQAKEKFLQLKEEHEKSMKERERKFQSLEDKARAKEQSLSQKIENATRKEKEVQNLKSDLEAQLEVINIKKSELEKIQSKRVSELSKVSNMSPEEAKNLLMEALKDEARTNAMQYIKDITDEAKLNATREAKKIVIQSIQRVATEQAIE